MENSAHKPKAVLWFDHHGALGPVSVADRLVQALEARGIEVVIAASKDSFDYKFASNARRHPMEMRNYDPSAELKEVNDSEKPDILITEHFPFVPNDSMRGVATAIALAREVNPKMKLYSIPRDIPYFTKPKEDAAAAAKLAKLYDGILVRGDKKVADFEKHFDAEQWQQISPKLDYIGYTIPPMPADKVTTGGGIVAYLGSLWQEPAGNILDVLPELTSQLQAQQWHFYVGGNPENYNSKKAVATFLSGLPTEMRDHVHFHWQNENFVDALQSADMVISRGGITAVEGVAYGKPTVILPLSGEQSERAEGLKPLAPSRIAIVDHTNLTELQESLNTLYAQRRVKASSPDLQINGHNNAAQGIADRARGIETAFSGRSK